jgi:hypothetical protein
MRGGDLLAAAAEAGLGGRLEALGDVLERGSPGESSAEVDAIAGELEAAGVEAPDLRDALRGAAVEARLGRPDYGAVMAAIDERLGDDAAEAERWADQSEGRMYLQSLAAGLLPLAGLDLDATSASAETFLVNFPSVSLPFGDVDERAANWLARLHDSPAIRGALRALLVRVGDTWAASYPLAAGQARRWGSGPLPSDPTADEPWMRALVALVRSQL